MAFDDETREIAKEIVRCGGLENRVKMALDYFDASINRISAWTVGYRNFQKALLMALVTPNEDLQKLQDEGNFTELMVRQEEKKHCHLEISGRSIVKNATYQWTEHGLTRSKHMKQKY